MARSVDRMYSRYSYGGSSGVFEDRTGFWQRQIYPKHDSDIKIEIDSRYHKRPWLVAHDKYRNSELMWFILQYNNILDVEEEFVMGKTIVIPTLTRLYMEILSRQPTSG